MKVSKTILQAVAIGLSIGAVTSCTQTDEITAEDLHNGEIKCLIELETEVGKSGHTWDCPACGMG